MKKPTTALLITDRMNSVIARTNTPTRYNYTPFGSYKKAGSALPFAAFNGEVRERCGQYYLLGNGYRVFNPFLMRFHSPDSASPFGEGGVNAYNYVGSDPINHKDPSGHVIQYSIPRLDHLVARQLSKNHFFTSALDAEKNFANSIMKTLMDLPPILVTNHSNLKTRALLKVAGRYEVLYAADFIKLNNAILEAAPRFREYSSLFINNLNSRPGPKLVNFHNAADYPPNSFQRLTAQPFFELAYPDASFYPGTSHLNHPEGAKQNWQTMMRDREIMEYMHRNGFPHDAVLRLIRAPE